MREEITHKTSIALLGAPNSGKTTLFNSLTGRHAQTGNWPGVTVDIKYASLRDNPSFEIFDLPGVYSLHHSSSPEEKTAQQYLNSGKISGVICMVSADQPRVGLTLALHVQQHGIPVAIALIRSRYLKKHKGMFDIVKLTGLTGIPVVELPKPSKLDPKAIMGKSGLLTAAKQETAGNISDCDIDIERVNRLLRETFTAPETDRLTLALDSILLKQVPSLFLFVFTLLLVMFLAFGPPGSFLTGLTEEWIFKAGEGLASWLTNSGTSEWLVSLLRDGVIAGVGGVLVFVPQFFVLFLLMGILEASGYMARAAFMLDPLMKKIGLSGRAVIPFILGFGCTVPALVSTRALPRRDRFIVMAVVPFASCGARLPVYAAFAAVFFPGGKWFLIPALYFGGIAVAILVSSIYSKIRGRDNYPFIMELPSYRMPAAGELFGYAGRQALTFIKKAGTVIFLASIVIWFLMSYGPSGAASSASDSFLAKAGGFIAPVLVPLGFGSWRAATALLSGIVAKEAVIGTLSILGGGSGISAALGSIFTTRSALSFLVFVLLYIPCIAALSTLWSELERKRQIVYIVSGQLLISYGFSALVYMVSGFFV